VNTLLARLRRVADDDAGFTLVELIITIFMLGVVVAPLTAIVILQLRNSDATTARMSESHDAQLANSWFAQDVQAVGVRDDYSGTAEPAFTQSIETSAPAAGGLYACGAAGTPDAVVRLAWDDYTAAEAASRTQQRVAYVVEGRELHRITCDGTGVVLADLTIAHNLVTPFAGVTCANAGGAAISCTGTALPATVSLSLTIRDPGSGSDSPYEVTLTGQRRQT
jgi:prepilin-type N-terminal cleavage/methylation domain-containing protein